MMRDILGAVALAACIVIPVALHWAGII